MDLGLRGKTAIVAAASRGLGKGVARALAAEGANVVMFSRNPSAIEAAAKEVRSSAAAGAQVVGLTADVTHEDEGPRPRTAVPWAPDRHGTPLSRAAADRRPVCDKGT